MSHRPECALVLVDRRWRVWRGWAWRSRGAPGAGHDRPAGPLHKTRSAVMARQGMAATSQPLATATAIRVLAAGRQRRRRGDRRQRRARRGRADVVRDRRRPVRHRLGRQDQAAHRPERQRPGAGGRHDRAVPGQGAGDDPRPRAAELVGPRLRRRLGPAPPAVRHPVAGPSCSRRRSPTPRLGFPVSEIIAGDWQEAEPSLARDPHLGRLLPARRPRAGGRVDLPQPGPRAVAPSHRPGRPRRLLQGAAGRRDRAVLAVRRRPVQPPGLRRAHQHVRRSGLDQLSRLRRLGAAAQRPGDRRAPDAQPARAVRPQGAWGRSRPRRCT